MHIALLCAAPECDDTRMADKKQTDPDDAAESPTSAPVKRAKSRLPLIAAVATVVVSV